MMILLLVIAAVVSPVEALRPYPAGPRTRAGRESGRNACLPRSRSPQRALPLKMAEVQNDHPAQIKLPRGSPVVELGFTSHVRASPL